jgi:hypothetical protein
MFFQVICIECSAAFAETQLVSCVSWNKPSGQPSQVTPGDGVALALFNRRTHGAKIYLSRATINSRRKACKGKLSFSAQFAVAIPSLIGVSMATRASQAMQGHRGGFEGVGGQPLIRRFSCLAGFASLGLRPKRRTAFKEGQSDATKAFKEGYRKRCRGGQTPKGGL